MNVDVGHQRPGRHRRVVVTVSFLVAAVTASVYARWPDGLGRLLMTATCLVFLATVGLAPLVRGARPRRSWLAAAAAAVGFAMAVLTKRVAWNVGPFPLSEMLFLLGYLASSVWLLDLTRRAGRRVTTRALLDTAAAAVGTIFALWTITELTRHSEIPETLVLSVHAILDVVVLSLAAHLAFRLHRGIRAWRWLFAGLSGLVVLDAVWAITVLVTAEPAPYGLAACYVFSYWALALGASHESVTDLPLAPSVMDVTASDRVRGGLIFAAVVPAVTAMMFPTDSLEHGLLRTVLTGVLLLLLLLRLMLTMNDVSRAEAVSHHRATHDHLTGLLNRAALVEALSARLRARTGPVAVLFLDCDDFKRVNDEWGHPTGDALLRTIAEMLPTRVRAGDLVARFGGDEFVVVASVTGVDAATHIADRIHAAFSTPIEIPGGPSHVMAPSIGIAVSQMHPGELPADLLQRADIALYEAKAAGGDRWTVYDDELHHRTLTRTALADALRDAIAADRLQVVFQPILRSPDSAAIVGWEAFPRWHDPVHGEVDPEEFLRLAEELGLIYDLGRVLITRTLHDLARLRREPGLADAIVSVNVTEAELRRPGSARVVRRALNEAGLPGEALWLEIPESLLIDSHHTVLETVGAIRDLGVRICLDDYGTGHASLSALPSFDFDCVKLHPSLVDRIDHNPDAPAQMRAVLDLLDALAVAQVVVVGVETPMQKAALTAIARPTDRGPMVQGGFYGHPVGPADIRVPERG